jgi:hypothetical protein
LASPEVRAARELLVKLQHEDLITAAMVTERESVERYLASIGELIRVPDRSPSRGPPYWKSTVLRRKALGDAA